jgi:predicted nuclease of predicted toxin-antitoxin system
LKILLDSCISAIARLELEKVGFDVVWVGDWPDDPGDEEILAYAKRENRVLVTLDKDFGEIAIVRGFAHCGIIRLVNFSVLRQALMC